MKIKKYLNEKTFIHAVEKRLATKELHYGTASSNMTIFDHRPEDFNKLQEIMDFWGPLQHPEILSHMGFVLGCGALTSFSWVYYFPRTQEIYMSLNLYRRMKRN